VVEMAPCLGLAPGLRARLAADALRLCARAGLTNAATVEFLVPLASTPSAEPYYFLEVNPRIQVRSWRWSVGTPCAVP
jgi:pyruvate carboxylase